MSKHRVGTGYHHGSLRSALIEATEALLDERGADGFSLREVARRTGVSPAAPAHHFGDATGLLTAVASAGFQELARRLTEAQHRPGLDARQRLLEQGMAYVGLALEKPGLFRLMFRSGQLRPDPKLSPQGQAAFEALADGVARVVGAAGGSVELTPAQWQLVVMLWSMVHGYAHLAIAGRLGAVVTRHGHRPPVPLAQDDRSAHERALRPMLQTIVQTLFPGPAIDSPQRDP